MIRFAIHCPPEPGYLKLAKQMGVTDIVTGPPRGEPGAVPSQAAWEQLRQKVEAAGLTLSVIESIPVSDRIKLGLPGRDEDIDAYRQSVHNMGAAGIPILCYNWMAVLFVLRTSYTTRLRGEALTVSYEHVLSERGPVPASPVPVTEELLWDSLAYFLRALVPVAEEAGVKLAMHPDDPPISPSRGVGRIFTSPAAFQRLLDLVPSPNNGMTYCQGCFSEMCADVPATIRHLSAQGKLHFAHFRHVRGPVTDFVELFHDERGNVDMFEAMKAYHESGFDGPMRPDHLPVMEGAAGDAFAEHMWGRLLAIGYMKGLLEGVRKSRGKEQR